MGLDCTHGAWHGAYSAFNRFRQVVAKAAGGSFPPHENASLDPTQVYFEDDTGPGLKAFLAHSDCDGQIAPDECALVADELEALLPDIEKLDDGDTQGGVSFSRTDDGGLKLERHPGHIARDGGFVAVTQRFIAGCRKAHAANEPLGFH